MELQRIWRSIRRRGMMVVQLLLVILTLGGARQRYMAMARDVGGREEERARQQFSSRQAGQGRAGPQGGSLVGGRYNRTETLSELISQSHPSGWMGYYVD